MSTLREIQCVAIKPQLKFGLGDSVDPADRLQDYVATCMRENGGELVRFGKRIGMALDANHYPVLELIGGCFGETMLLVTKCAMDKSFKCMEV